MLDLFLKYIAIGVVFSSMTTVVCCIVWPDERSPDGIEAFLMALAWPIFILFGFMYLVNNLVAWVTKRVLGLLKKFIGED